MSATVLALFLLGQAPSYDFLGEESALERQLTEARTALAAERAARQEAERRLAEARTMIDEARAAARDLQRNFEELVRQRSLPSLKAEPAAITIQVVRDGRLLDAITVPVGAAGISIDAATGKLTAIPPQPIRSTR